MKFFSVQSITILLSASFSDAFVTFVPSSSNTALASLSLQKSYYQRQVVVKSSFADEMPQEQQQQQQPTTFRECEVLGLRLMQEGRHEEALRVFQQGMKLPGSRPDVVRTKSLSGPSPVGGSFGGLEGKEILLLDEFETQAAHYNIACAFSRLGNVPESIKNLQLAFQAGFDNYATVRVDPDLSEVQGTAEFEDLMSQFEKKGFNPFSLFGKK